MSTAAPGGLLLLLVLLAPAPAPAAHAAALRECLVTGQAEVQWAWPPVMVRAWADPDLPDAPVLQLVLTLTGTDPRPQLVAVHAAGVKVMGGALRGWDVGRVGPGWVEVSVAITQNLTLTAPREGGRPLLVLPMPRPLLRLSLTASNLTVDCASEQMMWRVEGNWVGVPLAGQDSHPLLLYSRHPVLPSLSLPGAAETLTLAWDARHARLHATNSTPHSDAVTPDSSLIISSNADALGTASTSSIAASTTLEPHTAYSITVNATDTTHEALGTTNVSLQPLPPYTKHLLSLECGGREDGEAVLCEVKAEGRALGIFTPHMAPRVMRVRAGGHGPLYLRQITTKRSLAAPPPTTTTATTTTTSHPPPQLSTTAPGPPATTSRPQTPSPPTTRPHETPGGGGGGGGGGVGPAGWSGWWVFLTVLLTILLVFVIIMCIISHYHRPKLEKYLGGLHLMTEPSQEELETILPPPERRPLFLRSVSIINTEDPKAAAPLRLWNAVASGDEIEVEQVMTTLNPSPSAALEGLETTPYQEAHHRGHTAVLRVLEGAMNKRPDVPHNDMIIGVLQAHTKKVETVFEAARGGQYRHTGGVDVLLRAHSLPGTLHDHQGRSLLHYAASVMLADGGPLWLAQDVRSLVESHGLFVNAVDFKGYTALHTLAEHARNNEEITCWDGKTLSVCEAWMCLASLLMEVGCDPRLCDHHNNPPHQLAQASHNPRLAALFTKAASDLGPADTSPSLDSFPEMVEAAGLGDEATVHRLLRGGARVLPLGSRQDPLLEAVLGGHRNTVFLLLAAGAPLCAHGLLGNTPFEAAHHTPGLPALFPALIRKVFCDRLQAELEELPTSDQLHTTTVEGLIHLKTIAQVSGHRLGEELDIWQEHRPSPIINPANTLALVASLGLTLTCQLLGVAGVPLHPLPHLPHPLVLALTHSHHHTAYSLCRDLSMNPYSAGAALDTISEQLATDLIESELHKLERKLNKRGIGTRAVEDLLRCVRGQSSSHNLKQLQTLLYLLAELNLVTLLHRLRQMHPDLNLNMTVHEASDSTMLHVAAAHGKMAVVEYLLGRGIDQTHVTRNRLAPVHLAALRGQRECVNYMIRCCRAEPKCRWGLKPSDLLQYFTDNMKSRHLNLLTHKEAAAIAEINGEQAKARLILTSTCGKLGISSPTTLWHALEEEQRKMEIFTITELEGSIMPDIEEWCQQIGKTDRRFCGNVVSYPAVRKNTELLLPENFEFYLELEHYSALQGGCITLQTQDTPRGQKISVSSTRDQQLFTEKNFKSTFRRVAQEALNAAHFTTLTLVPPFLAYTATGVCVYAALQGPARVLLIRVMVTPVIRVPKPQWVALDHLPSHLQTQPGLCTQEHLTAGTDSNWVYLLNNLMEWVVSRTREEERRVLQASLYFAKLLETCWWLPKQEKRDFGRAWYIPPVGVKVPSAATLKSHFLEEILEQKQEAWNKEHWFSRVTGVMRRASFPMNIRSSPDTLRPNGAMQATLQFLVGLLENPIH